MTTIGGAPGTDGLFINLEKAVRGPYARGAVWNETLRTEREVRVWSARMGKAVRGTRRIVHWPTARLQAFNDADGVAPQPRKMEGGKRE